MEPGGQPPTQTMMSQQSMMSTTSTTTRRGPQSLRPRCELVEESQDVKDRERDRVCFLLASVIIEFSDSSRELSPIAQDVIAQLADALVEYPEIEIRLEGYAGKADATSTDSEQLQMLSSERGKIVREALMLSGVPNIWEWRGVGMYDTMLLGRVKVIPSERAPLLDPQARLDHILNRSSFEFGQKSPTLTVPGQLVVKTCARVLKETQDRLVIYVPQRSSQLAAARAESIRDEFLVCGITNEVVVRTSANKGVAFLELEPAKSYAEAMSPVEEEPLPVLKETRPEKDIPIAQAQKILSEILNATPLAFKRDKDDLVTDCLPILQEVSAVLRNAQCVACRIEVYTGVAPEISKLMARSNSINPQYVLAQNRSKALAQRLFEQGVDIKMQPVAYNYQKYSGPKNTALSGAHVDIALIDYGDEEEEIGIPSELMDIGDDSGVCTTGRCVFCVPTNWQQKRDSF